MPVRGPGQGPRGTGAGMRGPLARSDTYGKLAYQISIQFVYLRANQLINYYMKVIIRFFID